MRHQPEAPLGGSAARANWRSDFLAWATGITGGHFAIDCKSAMITEIAYMSVLSPQWIPVKHYEDNCVKMILSLLHYCPPPEVLKTPLKKVIRFERSPQWT